MEEKVAELCFDYNIENNSGFELLPKIAYTNALSSALSFYQKAKPLVANFIARVSSSFYIEIPSNLNPPFDYNKGSRVENIEFISRNPNITNTTSLQTVMTYIRKDTYVVQYSTDLNKWVIRFIGRINGVYRVYYTYIVNDISMFRQDEIDGMIYLAASFACEKIAARFARVFTQKIPADTIAYRDKVEYYKDISKEYRDIAYNILDINEKTGTMAYSTVASWGVRKIRRII